MPVHRAGAEHWQGSGVVGHSGVQNLMLAARSLGIGSVPTTLHAQVLERVYALLGFRTTWNFTCASARLSARQLRSHAAPIDGRDDLLNRWGAAVPWAAETAAV